VVLQGPHQTDHSTLNLRGRVQLHEDNLS
jgi:hypothetical protein